MNSLSRCFTLLVASSLVFVTIFLVYICPLRSCSVNKFLQRSYSDDVKVSRTQPRLYRFTREAIKMYNINKSIQDVMVFLHIQKTGGTTFGKHLVRNLNISFRCKCRVAPRFRCACKRPNNKIWLFSRYSLGWPCGLHADWTELKACVPNHVMKLNGKVKNQTFLYVTFLREPVTRVLSEFRSYQRGTTWATSKHKCNGRVPTKKELTPCYEGETWEDVTMDRFIGCKSNLAFNRQSRMLADLTLVNCYNRTGLSRKKRQKAILKSAMRNLKNMAYFGLTEYQKESQYLFEKTFGIKFIKPFVQKEDEETRAADVMTDIQKEDLKQIKKLSSNDIRFYRYAKELFFYRVKYFKDRDKDIEKV